MDHVKLSARDAYGLERCFCWQEKEESLANNSLLVLDNVEG